MRRRKRLRKKLHRRFLITGCAWVVTFAGTAVNLCLGILYAWSVWKANLTADADHPAGMPMTGLNEGWTYLTDAQATWAYALCGFIFALFMIPGGRLQDRYGPKLGATLGGLSLAGGCILAGLMKSYLGLILGFGVSGCSGDPSTSPSPASVSTFRSVLLPANEVPAITGAEANGSGNANLTFHVTRDSVGTITAATLDITVSVTGFPAGTALTGAHIHPGVEGVNGGIVVSFGLAPGEVTFATGSGSFSRAAVAVTADQANSILANPAGFYVNIHTAANPGGVARGQLTLTQ